MTTIQVNKDIFTHLLNCYLKKDEDVKPIRFDQLQKCFKQAGLSDFEIINESKRLIEKENCKFPKRQIWRPT